MFYVGKEVLVKSGQYKGLVGTLTSTAGCDTYFTVMKKDGVKVRVHYKDILDVETTPVKVVGKKALLRKCIKVDGKKQSFTLCKIIEKFCRSDDKNHLGKIKVKTLDNQEILVNCNAILAVA